MCNVDVSDSVLMYDKMKSYWDKMFNMDKTDTETGYMLVDINKTIQQRYVSYDELWEL